MNTYTIGGKLSLVECGDAGSLYDLGVRLNLLLALLLLGLGEVKYKLLFFFLGKTESLSLSSLLCFLLNILSLTIINIANV